MEETVELVGVAEEVQFPARRILEVIADGGGGGGGGGGG